MESKKNEGPFSVLATGSLELVQAPFGCKFFLILLMPIISVPCLHYLSFHPYQMVVLLKTCSIWRNWLHSVSFLSKPRENICTAVRVVALDGVNPLTWLGVLGRTCEAEGVLHNGAPVTLHQHFFLPHPVLDSTPMITIIIIIMFLLLILMGDILFSTEYFTTPPDDWPPSAENLGPPNSRLRL